MTTSVRIGANLEPVQVSDVSVRRSLEDPMRSCRFESFTNTRRFLGEPLQIEFDVRRVFTGSAERHTGTAERGFSVEGRSQTVALELFEADNNKNFRRTTDGGVIKSLADEIGLTLADTRSSPVSKFKIRKGVSYRRGAQELAQAHSWVLTDDGMGRIRMFNVAESPVVAESWVLGRLPVLDIRVDADISELRQEVVYRGARLPINSDISEAIAGQIGVEVFTDFARRSRRVLTRGVATSRADAGTVVQQHLRLLLAGAYTVTVDLVETAREIGDIVYISGRDGTDLPMVISELTETRSATNYGAQAVCRLAAVYSGDIRLAPDGAQVTA